MTLTRGFYRGGLVGSYYDDPKRELDSYEKEVQGGRRVARRKPIDFPTFTRLAFSRVDKAINFHWNTYDPPQAPDMAEAYRRLRAMNCPESGGRRVGPHYFSVRWSGKLMVPQDGEYTFYLDDLDDGGRVFIDGREVIDAWYVQFASVRSSPIFLTRGLHTVRVDYAQGPEFRNSIVFCWSSPFFGKEVVGLADRRRR